MEDEASMLAWDQQGAAIFVWQGGGRDWVLASARRRMCCRHWQVSRNEVLLLLGDAGTSSLGHGAEAVDETTIPNDLCM
jgi:hypothetical protein